MSFQTFVFYAFAAILVFAGLRVITTRNPVHAALCSVMFLGGWLAPLPILNDGPLAPILGDGVLWLFVKMSLILFIFLWIRATFPRYRYDQIMRLGWKVFIPVTLVWIVFLGIMMQTRWAYLFH